MLTILCEMHSVDGCAISIIMERYFMNFSIVPFLQGSRPAPMRAIAGSAAFAAAALLLPPLPAQAGMGSWTSTGPYGGIVQTLVVDPKTPATLYAASAGGGVFKSIDR